MTRTPDWMKVKSFDHQMQGLRRLIDNDGVYALLWDAGVGKTKCVIDYLSWLSLAAKSEVRVLVVCPKIVTDSWVEQTERYGSVKVDAKILEGSINKKAEEMAAFKGVSLGETGILMRICNLDAFSSRRTVSKTSSKLHSDLLLESVKKFAPHVLVVDESHRCKGKSSNAGRLLARIAPHVKRRILLTGTLLPHSPLDAWSQARVLDPQIFSTNGKPWSFGQFQQWYAVMGGFMGKEIKGFKYLDDLEKRLGTRSMVVRKQDALDLPPTTDVMVPVTLDLAEAKAYQKMMKDLLVQLDSGDFMSAPSRLTQMLRLRQITSGYVKADASEDYTFIGDSRIKVALSVLEDLMATENRVVVFAWGRPEVDRMVERINSNRLLNEAVAHGITGDTSDAERLRLRKLFASDSKERLILVCQARTVSLGINEFVAASHALFLSLSQQRDDWVQGRARLDRQGQTRPVTFWTIGAPGTIDEIIHQSHKDRTNLEDQLLRHIREGIK